MLPVLVIDGWPLRTLNGELAEWESGRNNAEGMNTPQSGIAVLVLRTRTACDVLLKSAEGCGNETAQCTRCVLLRIAGLRIIL